MLYWGASLFGPGLGLRDYSLQDHQRAAAGSAGSAGAAGAAGPAAGEAGPSDAYLALHRVIPLARVLVAPLQVRRPQP